MKTSSFAAHRTVIMTAFILLVSLSCDTGSAYRNTNVSTQPSVPNSGVYIGALLLSGQTTIEQFNRDLGVQHAMFGDFFKFPEVLNVDSQPYLKLADFIEQCRYASAIPVLTLTTDGGLESYTSEQITEMADILNRFNISLILRWNHEMNGSWYAWRQQPKLYVRRFQEFATVIHARAPNVAMAWTPNQGWGYPWEKGTFSNTDLTSLDDPYAPYYPGDDFVDWVGHSFYHWSNTKKNGINQKPELFRWGRANGIDSSIPNFHDIYAVGHNKPMLIAETSAFYDPLNKNGGDASEFDIKTTWIEQVYNISNPSNPSLPKNFPKLKAILWFSQEKHELEVDGTVDWRLNSSPALINFYRDFMADPYFIKAVN